MSIRKFLPVFFIFVLLLSSCTTPATQPPAAEVPPAEQAEAPAQPEAPAEAEEPAEPAQAEEPAEAEPPAAGEPVVLRIGWAGSPDTLNPGPAVLTESYILFELVYDSMFILNLDGTYSPELAESYESSEDGLVWTFKLRPGITWHDGEPLTASDVAFSYNFYAANEDFPYMPVYTIYFESVEAPDDSTVVITLTEPIPNMESQLIFLYVLPEHIWSAHTENASEFENLEMIGSGPFKLVEYRQNEFAHLAAVKDHYLTPPKIDEVVFQTFDNQDALVQAIKTGQVDLITEMPNTAVASLRNEENVEVVSGAPLAPGVSDIIFNVTPDDLCPVDEGGVCSGHPALKDRNVRLALAHATDKQKIIDVVLLGMGDPGLTLIPNGLGVWYNESIQDYEYDIAKANQILDEAGYLDQDGDGVRDMPDGSQPLIFRMNYPSDSISAPRESELLSEMWGEVGVKLEIQALDPDALTSVCCPTFDYDIILWGWGSDPDPGFLLSVMLTDEIPSGNSETGYANPEFDELYAQQATELDFETRKALVWKMQEIVHSDIVYIIPYYELTVQAYRTDRFTGWILDQPKLALEDISSLVVVEPVK